MPAASSRCNRVSAVNTAHLTALHLALLLVTAAATTTATASAAAQHVLPIRAHASSSPSSSSGCASLSSTATTWSAAMHSQHAGYPAGPAEATAAAGHGAPVPAAGGLPSLSTTTSNQPRLCTAALGSSTSSRLQGLECPAWQRPSSAAPHCSCTITS